MPRPKKGNDASRFRDLRRRARKKADVTELEEILKEISDPYFRSQSHILIAQLTDDRTRIERALGAADRVEALWRRAELFGELLKLSKDLDKDTGDYLIGALGDRILLLPNGKGLSDALSSCSSRLPAHRFPELLRKAIGNKGFELKDSKNVLKAWSRSLPGSLGDVKELLSMIAAVKDNQLRAQLSGYIHLQLERSGIKDIPHAPLEEALESAFELRGEERLDMVAYLATTTSSKWAVELLNEKTEKDTSIAEKTKMISYTASAADRAGHKDLADSYVKKAIEMTGKLENLKKRSGIRLHLAQNLLRMSHEKEALLLMEGIRSDTEEGDPTRMFMVKALEKAGVKVPEGWETPIIKEEEKETVSLRTERDVLALYDTYEGAIKEIHVRAIARAAPLCYGFDLDLALIGFPEDDPKTLVARVAKETNIGKGGKFLMDLLDQGRIHLVKASKNTPPKDWKTLGLPVATTSRPDKNKLMDMETAHKRSDSSRICLVMGLGKQGLPKSMLEAASAHLELTGKNIPLETATAMGIISYQLYLSRR